MDPIFGIRDPKETKPTNTTVRIIGNTIRNINYLNAGELKKYKHARYGGGISINARDAVILDNSIRDVDRNGIVASHRGGSEIRVAGNSISNCGERGILASTGTDLIIADNEITDAGKDDICVNRRSGGGLSMNVIVSGNTLNGAGATGFEDAGIFLGAENVKVAGNLIRTAKKCGVRCYQGKNATIEQNQIYSAGLYGISINGHSSTFSENVLVGGNTLIRHQANPNVNVGGTSVTVHSPYPISLEDASTGVIVTNNYYINYKGRRELDKNTAATAPTVKNNYAI